MGYSPWGHTESAHARTLRQQASRLFPCLPSLKTRQLFADQTHLRQPGPGGFFTQRPVPTQHWLNVWAPEHSSGFRSQLSRLLAVCARASFLVCGMEVATASTRGD